MKDEKIKEQETHECKGCGKQILLDKKRCKNCDSTTSRIRDEISSITGIYIPPLW